jgi:ankyrin repeat protein
MFSGDLYAAAELGYTDIVLVWCRSGSLEGMDCVNPATNLNSLHIAVKNRHPDVVLVLLEAGCDVECMCKGKTPLIRATWGARLRDVHAPPSGQLVIAQLLLQYGADVAGRSARGETPIHGAVMDRNHAMVLLLLRNGADVCGRNRQGWAPLHYGTLENNPYICELLLERGANKHAKNRQGLSSWKMAQTGHASLVKVFREYGNK